MSYKISLYRIYLCLSYICVLSYYSKCPEKLEGLV
jgi:hypothetical protein